jgi:FMN reductase
LKDLKFLVISCSLHPASKSFRLARLAEECFKELGAAVELLDLRELDLPFCDGRDSKLHPNAVAAGAKVAAAASVLLAGPIYNYDLNAAAKNLVELTGKAWQGKPVGFLCAAGGRASYMSPMGLANSLMLDFRSLILPRYVYASREDFSADGEPSTVIRGRVAELTPAALERARGLEWARSAEGKRA